MQTLLIIGFEPFDNETINPSRKDGKRVTEIIGPWHMHKMQIPAVFSQAVLQVIRQGDTVQPDAILCLSQVGGRRFITPEMAGINLRNGTDNAGCAFQDGPVVPGGPDAYFTTLPVRQMEAAMKATDVAAAVSFSDGTYVCNDTLYTLLHHFHGTGVRVGFVHIPFLPQQAGEGVPSMMLEDMVKGLGAGICF